jgi:hypothetical protein
MTMKTGSSIKYERCARLKINKNKYRGPWHRLLQSRHEARFKVGHRLLTTHWREGTILLEDGQQLQIARLILNKINNFKNISL